MWEDTWASKKGASRSGRFSLPEEVSWKRADGRMGNNWELFTRGDLRVLSTRGKPTYRRLGSRDLKPKP